MEWQLENSAPENVVVETKIDDGRYARNQVKLKRQGRLWFYPDGSMYVYYTPTHWSPIEKARSISTTGS